MNRVLPFSKLPITCFCISLFFYFIACQNSDLNHQGQLPLIIDEPLTIPVETKKGYRKSPFRKDTIRIVVNELGDTVLTGTPYEIFGMVTPEEKVAYPRSTPVREPIIKSARTNISSLTGHTKEILIDGNKLRQFDPDSDAQNYVLTNTIGDTLPSGVPIPVKEIKVRCLFPAIVKTKPMSGKYDAFYNIQSLDVDHGLLYPNITSLLFDSKGYLWIGMLGGGLTRYDGSTAMLFTKHNRLINNYVSSIFEDKNGNIWTGTSGGLCRFDGEYMTYFTVYNGLTSQNINCITEDKAGNIWLGSLENGISCYRPSKENKPGTLTHYSIKDGLSEMFITDILEDKNGNMWFASKTGGVSMFEPKNNLHAGKVTYFTLEDGLPSDKILDIMEDKAGNIWFGTDKGACRFNMTKSGMPGSSSHFLFNADMPEYPVQKIYEDSEGNIWFCTMGGGAIKLIQNDVQGNNHSKFVHFTEEDGLPINRILTIQEDNSGNIWLGTNGGGICCIKANPIRHYGENEGLTEYIINAFYEDVKGNIWFGTSGEGLIMYRPPTGNLGGVFFHYSMSAGLPDNFITSISGDNQGNIWMGTSNSGICKFDGQFFTTYSKLTGLLGNDVTSILMDQTGNLWVGHSQGFSFLAQEYQTENRKPVFVRFTEAEGLLEKYIFSIYEDRNGKIWLGSKRGLSQFQMSSNNKSGQIIHLTEREGLPFWNVHAFEEDPKGNMWIGTGGALVYYESSSDSLTGTFTMYAPQGDQMTGINPTTKSVKQDYHGNIWFGSEGGINLLIPQKDTIPSYRYRQFTKEDGLRGNTSLLNSVLFDQNHQAWWGNSYGGAEVINLEQSKMSETSPRPNLNGIEINERIVDFQNNPDSIRKEIDFDSVPSFENYPVDLKLSHRHNNLIFHFSAIDWSAPHKVRYSFHMKGLNNSWSNPSAETKAEFRSLPYGRYTLEIKAFGESQQWSSAFEYPFRIRPPWWYSWWAYVMYGLMGSTVIFSAYRFQLNRKLEVNEKKRLVELDQVKNRLYGNIAHEFRTPLTLIHGPVSQALNSDVSLNKKDIQSIYKQSERLQQLINQMLDLQKLEAGKLKPNYEFGNILQTLRYLFYSFEAWAGEKKINLAFSANQQEVFMDYDQEKLAQIITNLVSNAIKHTPRNGKVFMIVNASPGEDLLFIQIRDTGVGISEEDLPFIFDRYYQSKRAATGGSGIGLALTQNLIELLGGSISVESALDLGSTFKISLPITKNAPLTNKEVSKVGSVISLHENDDVQFIAPDADPSGKPIILIVEDHPEIAQYVAACLASDYTTVIASNGNDGLRMAYEHIPDLIVSDIMMPGKDGFELTGILKTDILTSHIPIILLTGRGDHDSFISGLERGADAYVTKPFEPMELLLRIKKLLELRANLSLFYRNQTTVIDNETHERISARENEFIKQLRLIVEEHINDSQFNMNMLSKLMAMSHPQLHRKITALTGESTGKFVRSVRLGKAIELLKNSDLTISEIAYETGFSEPGYFTKTFSKEYNMSPTEYRGSLS